MSTTIKTWVLADHGKTGTYNQCLGLAQWLGLTPEFKTIKPRYPWHLLPPRLWVNALQAQTPGHCPLAPPWPDLVIAAGRASVAPALAIQKEAKICFTIVLQNPYMDPTHFSCVIAPFHDHLTGPNVLPITGSLHGLSDTCLKAAASAYPRPSHSPITTVLIGGDSRHYCYQIADMTALAKALKKIGGHCLVTASRRTRPELMAVFKAALRGTSHDIWNGEGENPFHAYLGLADQVIVTQDSISMTTEACFTGKPVYIWELAHKSSKFHEYYNDLYIKGYARPFQWPFPHWHPKKLNEMERVTAFVRQHVPLLNS